jgi:hypothetical protein
MHLPPKVGPHWFFQYIRLNCTWVLPTTTTMYATWAPIGGFVLAKIPRTSAYILYYPHSLTLNKPEREYPTSVHELAAHLGQPDLLKHIRQFLYWQQNQDDKNMDIPLLLCPEFDLDISVFHSGTSTFHSPSNPSGPRGMCREVV